MRTLWKVVCTFWLVATAASSAADSKGVCYIKSERQIQYTYVAYKTVRETYYESCYIVMSCTEYRYYRASYTEYKMSTQYYAKEVCCSGYQKSEQSGLCEPVCQPGCGPRFECTAPGRCTCQDGYELQDTKCLSACEIQGCKNGTCIDLNTCVCDVGYNLQGGDCLPVCDSRCSGPGAYCFAPGDCRCQPGYAMTSQQTCAPKCLRTLIHAVCAAPEEYRCLQGYEFESEDDTEYRCRPVCVHGCANGECSAPNTCSCLPGYSKDGPRPHHLPDIWSSKTKDDRSVKTDLYENICWPTCQNTCQNGQCISPDTCSCFDGYESDLNDPFNSTCIPICPYSCVNANCTEPGTCSCYNGYEVDPSDETNSTCIPVCSNECVNGNCTEPEICTCYEDFEVVLEDGGNFTCRKRQSLHVDGKEACHLVGLTCPIAGGAFGAAVLLLLVFAAAFGIWFWRKRENYYFPGNGSELILDEVGASRHEQLLHHGTFNSADQRRNRNKQCLYHCNPGIATSH